MLFSIAGAQAQGRLELKLNPVTLVVLPAVELAGEYLLNKRVGLEAGIGFFWEKDVFTGKDTVTGDPVKVTFRSGQINAYLSGKYYFSPRQGGDRLFAGPVLFHHFYTSLEYTGQPIKKPGSSTAVGADVGYKWLIRKRWVLEPSLRGIFYFQSLSDRERGSFVLGPNLKAGYRFP
jgi:hypothetical protein